MEAEFILYVSNLEKSKTFYAAILGKKPILDIEGMVEFELVNGVKLGLMPENGIAKIICPALKHPSSANAAPRCELYLKTNDSYLLFSRAKNAGASIISEPKARDWGDEVSYVSDPDGHVIAFAKSMSKDQL